MSVVKYNGITLPYAYISDFRMEGIYDESGTDRVYTMVDMTAQAVINPAYGSILLNSAVFPTTTNVADLINNLENYFMESRRELSVKFNGTELIPGTAGVGGFVDAKNGPVPKFFQLLDMTNNNYFMTWRVVGHYWGNFKRGNAPDKSPLSVQNVINQPGNNVISNRWEEHQDIDNRNYSKLTRSGKYIIRSDNVSGIIADDARTQMAVVGVPKGFLRESSRYVVQKDGLGLAYNIVDQEVFRMPPSPAFKADGWYEERVQQASEGVRHGTAYIRLEGDKLTSQADLARVAIATAAAVIRLRTGALVAAGGVPGGILEDGKLKIGKFDNWAEATLRCMYSTGKARIEGIAGFNGISITTPFSDPAYTPAYLSRGTAASPQGVLLQAAAYYDPSLRDTVLNFDGQLTGPMLEVGKAGKSQEPSKATPKFS